MIVKYLIIIFIVCSVGCNEKKQNDNYKKQSDISSTGKSINKKNTPASKTMDFYWISNNNLYNIYTGVLLPYKSIA